MLLQKYPEYKYYIQTDIDGLTVFHHAAIWSNTTALRMIKDHLQTHYPNKVIPWGIQARSYTVLDAAVARLVGKDTDPVLGHSVELSRVAAASSRLASIACYRFLRENGALHHWELTGVLLS